MARIRTIKPEFWIDEKLAPLSPIERLTFLGLISMADDAGRLVDNLKQIDAFVFGETEDTCRDALATLSRIGRVIRGKTKSGQKVIQIANWSKHQKVDKPNLLAALPKIEENTNENTIRDGFATDSRQARDGLATLPTTNDLRPTTNDLRSEDSSAVENPTAKPLAEIKFVLEFPCVGQKKSWGLTESQVFGWSELYPTIDVLSECRKALAWVQANKRKTASGMQRFLVRWLNKATDSSRSSSGSGEVRLTPIQQREENMRQVRERLASQSIPAITHQGESK